MISIDTIQILNDTIQITSDTLTQKVEIINFPIKSKLRFYEYPWIPNLISSLSLLATIGLFFWNKSDSKKTERMRKEYEDQREKERKEYENIIKNEGYKYDEYRRRKEENFQQKMLEIQKQEQKHNWIRDKVYKLWEDGLDGELKKLRDYNDNYQSKFKENLDSIRSTSDFHTYNIKLKQVFKEIKKVAILLSLEEKIEGLEKDFESLHAKANLKHDNEAREISKKHKGQDSWKKEWNIKKKMYLEEVREFHPIIESKINKIEDVINSTIRI